MAFFFRLILYSARRIMDWAEPSLVLESTFRSKSHINVQYF